MRSPCSLLVDSDLITDFSARANQRGATKTNGHDRLESPVTMNQNDRSRSAGIAGHGQPEYPVLTRVVLARYWTYSLDAELIRTPLRLLAVAIYWALLRDMIKSQPLPIGTLAQQPLIGALLLFLSVPILVGDLSYMTPLTKLVYAATSIVMALKEEIAFRALILNLIAKRFGTLAAILITTILFTAYHIGAIPMGLFAYGQVVLAGLILGIVYARIPNLWFVVWLHTLYDAL